MNELSIAQIISVAGVIIANPDKSVFTELGIKKTDVGLLIFDPTLFAAKKAYDWIKQKVRANEEKERMYKEIIRKQEAALERQREINRELERRLRESDANNKKNQEEIRELRRQITNLEDLINILKKAQGKVAV